MQRLRDLRARDGSYAAWSLCSTTRRTASRGELEELGVDAAALVGPVLVARRDLGAAHRQRPAHGADCPEAALAAASPPKLEVDLDGVDLLHAADVRPSPLLVGIEERACAVDAGARIDDLVAVNLAPATFGLLLRSER